MKRVCLTNDDGSRSIGLHKLAKILSKEVALTVVVPDRQRSGTGKALTLDRPIRIIEDDESDGYRLISHDGFPADSVIIAKHFMDKIDLVVSGINSGANVGYHRIYTSGTLGAVLEAAFHNYPAIALSQNVDAQYWFEQKGADIGLDPICDRSMNLIKKILGKGLPTGIDALNVNFPMHIDDKTESIVVKPAKIQVDNTLEQRKDPNNSNYFWISGSDRNTTERGDSYELAGNGKITISPIVLEGVTKAHIESVNSFLD